ncbi:hypothetical protein [Endozoicomonas atrinae]|uniref:hypothetical protein n=1 Tax=Endozoicomonas atrinae TaxID=1333660 RepID=UPI003AFFC9AE
MEKAWAIIIDDDQAACMMAIPRLFEQLPVFRQRFRPKSRKQDYLNCLTRSLKEESCSPCSGK